MVRTLGRLLKVNRANELMKARLEEYKRLRNKASFYGVIFFLISLIFFDFLSTHIIGARGFALASTMMAASLLLIFAFASSIYIWKKENKFFNSRYILLFGSILFAILVFYLWFFEGNYPENSFGRFLLAIDIGVLTGLFFLLMNGFFKREKIN